jgi:hypothetical protein
MAKRYVKGETTTPARTQAASRPIERETSSTKKGMTIQSRTETKTL